MKNPFKRKNDNTALKAVGVTGVVAASLVVYLYLSDGLAYIRRKMMGPMHQTSDGVGDNLKEDSKSRASTLINDKNGVSKHTVKALANNINKKEVKYS
jgi:hypothetical protein